MAKKAQLDFTNVKDGGGFNKKHQAPGDYRAKIMKVEDVTKKDDKSIKMWLWTIKVGSGVYPYYTTHTGEGAEKQLWKIRNLFVAAGKNVPKKRVSVDPDSIVGKDIGVTLADEEYNDRLQSVIEATFPTSELEDSDPVDAEDDDDDEEETDEEESEDEEEEPTPPPAKKKKKKAPEPEDDDDEDDDDSDDDEEEEDEPEPPKKTKKKKKAAKVDDDELEELDIEDI